MMAGLSPKCIPPTITGATGAITTVVLVIAKGNAILMDKTYDYIWHAVPYMTIYGILYRIKRNS